MGFEALPSPGAPLEQSGLSAESGNPSLPPPPSCRRCSCKHVSLHVCFPFSLTVAITGCCLPKSRRAEASSWTRPPLPAPPCPYSGLFLFHPLVRRVKEAGLWSDLFSFYSRPCGTSHALSTCTIFCGDRGAFLNCVHGLH